MRHWPADPYPGGADRDDVPHEPEWPVCPTCDGMGVVHEPVDSNRDQFVAEECPQCEGGGTVTVAEAEWTRDSHPESECDERCVPCDACYLATGKDICRACCPHAGGR